jgi:hypothetical protein
MAGTSEAMTDTLEGTAGITEGTVNTIGGHYYKKHSPYKYFRYRPYKYGYGYRDKYYDRGYYYRYPLNRGFKYR